MIRRLFALVLLAPLAACGWFEDPSPDRAFFSVDEGEGLYRVVVSTEFVAGTNQLNQVRVELFSADTVLVTAPFAREVDIRGKQRFFVEVLSASGEPDAHTVRVTVDIDAEQQMNVFRDVSDDPIRFAYQFNQRATTDVVEVF